MRQVYHKSLEQNVSALGFGTASLGSRVSLQDGKRAVHMALDHGITWFDTAPPYGDGEAEGALGNILTRIRQKVVICTKFGIEPPIISPVKKLARPLARLAIKAVPSLRGQMKKARPVGEVRQAIDVMAIRPSVERSLKRLKTDYIDVLAIHEPAAAIFQDHRVFEVLEKLKTDGLIRTVSVAGSPEAVRAGIDASRLVSTAQFPDMLFDDHAQIAPNGLSERGYFCVTHSIMAPPQFQGLDDLMTGKPDLANALLDRLGIQDRVAKSAILLACALAHNACGTVVMSMFTEKNLLQNIAVASRAVAPLDFQELKESTHIC